MITLADAKKDFKLLRDLPELERGRDFKMLWHSNYWDGVLSGMLSYQDRMYWFDCALEGVVARAVEGYCLMARAFAILALTDEQIAELTARHKDFQDNVGGHTDYTYDAQGGCSRPVGDLVGDEARQSAYYARAKTREPVDLSQNEVIGWWSRAQFDADDLTYDMVTYEQSIEIFKPKGDT